MYNANGYEKFDNLLNIEIHYVMPLFEQMVIDFESINLNKNIMHTYNKQHQLCLMWL
jgi:uncharacterized membrane protein YukC